MRQIAGRPQSAARWLTILAVGLSLSLAGCDKKDLLTKMSSPEDRALCATLIGDLQQGPSGDADLVFHMNPQLRAQFADMAPKLRAMTPSGPGATSRLVDASFRVSASNTGPSAHEGYLAYEVDQANRRALLRFDIVRQGGATNVNSLYINPLYVPAEQVAGFTFAGKTLTQYLVLALAIAAFITIIVSEVALARTPGVKRRWLWVLGCLFGYSQIWVDWSSGAAGFQLLNIQLLGAFALKAGLLAPWRIGFGLPIVSIIFLLRRRQLANRPEPKLGSSRFAGEG